MPRRLAALLVLCAALAARAADAPADSQDALAAAKKDLADIKAGAGTSDSQAALPSVDMKALNPGPGADRQMLKPQLTEQERAALLDPAARKARQGTGNWLVDAMDKQEGRSDSKDGAGRALADPTVLDPLRAQERLDSELLSPREPNEESARKEPAEPVYNPLDAFMGGWVSARDKDLLLPAGHGGETHPGADLPLAGQDLTAELLAAQDTTPYADVKAGANPYLDVLSFLPAAEVHGFTNPELPDFSLSASRPASSGVLTDERPPEQARSFVPDFAQPSDDDKYFKQMKRF